MFNQEEAKFLLEAVFEKSLSTKLGDVINGLKPSEMVNEVVRKLKDAAGLNESTKTPEAAAEQVV